MKKNTFLLLFFALFISACNLPPNTLDSSNNPQSNPFKINPNTHLPVLPPGFGPRQGPLIKPRNGQYPANYYNRQSYSSFNSSISQKNFNV